MRKRLLVSLLSLVMVLTMLPAAALAADPPEETAPVEDCICTELCTVENINGDCPVCGGEGGYSACAYTEPEETVPAEEEPAEVEESIVCTGEADCPSETHNEGCPLYEANVEPSLMEDGEAENDASQGSGQVPANGTYSISTWDDLQQALSEIEEAGIQEAEIQLTSKITLEERTFGLQGVHLTVRSVGGTDYSITTKSGENRIYLAGDVTFQNVKPSGSLFACGHTVEFGEEYSGIGLRLYGGADYDLDLTTNGDADGSTHIIIRSGKFKSIVGGNKDTFTQGKYHDYADWSDPKENKHTTLTGDVQIDIYGGSFGGSYNIDVGDTCCNTNVTPCKLYGGGLGSDTIGDITINVYGLDAASGYNCNIVGGGFGMAGGEDDTTLYNDAIKHTGIVDGNVNLNLLGGNIAEFYGGGWHGGSAYKNQSNVSSERAAQRQYHREEVAVVTGDVNIVMGGTMTLCQNQSQAWGGSYASTIKGDVNITIKDKAKLAARYSLNNGGAPTPENMGQLDGKYAQYYDGMYTGTGWDSGFYACGQYDIICGSVNLDIEDGYAWSIQGTPFTDPFAELPVEKTEIRNEENEEYGINIDISGGMVHDLWGDYEGGKIADGIAINLSGGEVFAVNTFDGRNSSLEAGAKVDVTMSGGTVYNMVGQYSRMRDGVSSSITFEQGTGAKPIKLGYLVGFDQVTAAENSNTLIDAVAVMEQYQIAPSKYGATADVPFYENVYDLTIEENATLVTCKNKTNLLGDVSNTEGTWIAYGPVTIDGNSQSSGTIFFNQPSTVEGNAAWTGDALLLLPVVENDKNYDGATNIDIALIVGGTSSGKAMVRTVEPEDYTQAVKPTVGDNYILSAKQEGETPLEGVYVLENTDAVSDGLYLKRLDDPKQESNNYMWQVARDTTLTLRPEDQTIYSGGESGDVINPEFPHPIYLDRNGIPLDDDVTFKVNDTEWSDPPHEYPFTVKYYDKDNNEITDDQHYGDFTARIVPTVEGTITTGDGRKVEFKDGTLRIRYVSSFTDATANALTTDALEYTEDSKETVREQAEATGEAAVLLPGDTTIYLNGNPNYEYPEDAPYQIALLFDELLPTTQGGSNQTYVDALTAHAQEKGFDLTGMETMFRYLDLVDNHNSNAWVSSSQGSDVFWPYPTGTNQSTDFQVLHFEGLHREYSMDGTSSSLQQQIAASNVETVDYEKTDAGIWFHVDSSGFSPFALAWTAKGGGENPGGSGGNRPGGGGGGGGGGGTGHYILRYESNGGTEYDDERYAKYTLVDLDKVPTREGYTFTGWYADEELTERITEIRMTSNKTVYAGWEATGVPDLLNGDDHFAYVIGYADGTVRPLDNISRAEVATIIFRLLDPEVRDEYLTTTNTFEDVNEGMWCNTAISTLARLGIVYGRTSTFFDPDASITRAEFAAICARFDNSGIEADSSFTDISGHWAEDEIELAATLGWIRGYTDGTFRPNNLITRAEAMTMINRMLQRLPEDEDDLLPEMNVWPDNQPDDWYYLAVQEATNSHDFNRKSDGVHEHWTELTADPDWKQYEE